MRFLAQSRLVRFGCVAAGRCAVLSGGCLACHPLACCSATRIAVGHGAPTRTPPLGLAFIVPCGPGSGCCDTPSLTTVSGQDFAGGASSHHHRAVGSTHFFHSFTRVIQTTTCLDLLVVCRLPSRGLLMYALSRFGCGSATRFQGCTYMWNNDADNRTTYTLCLPLLSCLCALPA